MAGADQQHHEFSQQIVTALHGAGGGILSSRIEGESAGQQLRTVFEMDRYVGDLIRGLMGEGSVPTS